MAPSSTSTLSSRAYQDIRSSAPTLAGSLAFTRSRGLAARSKKRRHNEGVASPLDTERLFVRGNDLGQGDNYRPASRCVWELSERSQTQCVSPCALWSHIDGLPARRAW